MQVSRHLIYERSCRDEENAFLREALVVVAAMPKPGGWTRRQDGGRPPRDGRGRPVEYPWSSLVVGLLLMGYLGIGYRAMAANLAARPELMERLGEPMISKITKTMVTSFPVLGDLSGISFLMAFAPRVAM